MVQAAQVILTHALQPGRGCNNVYIARCVTFKTQCSEDKPAEVCNAVKAAQNKSTVLKCKKTILVGLL